MYLDYAHNGIQFQVTEQTKPQDVIQALGKPNDTWDDDMEKCLTYESEEETINFMFCVRHFFFKPEGKLKGVEIERRDASKRPSD